MRVARENPKTAGGFNFPEGVSGRSLRRAVIASSVLLLSSCALIKGSETPRETYDLSAPTSFSNIRGSSRSQILVKAPTALKSIDSDRMIVKPTSAVITYLAGAQWADTVPNMVQSKLVETLENSGATAATAKPGDGLVIDYQLVSDIRRFEIQDGLAVIQISIKLLADKTGLVRETRIFTATSRTTGSTPDAYVAAFDASFDELAREVALWVVNRT